MKKKVLGLLLGVSLAAGVMAGCGNKEPETPNTPETAEASEEAPADGEEHYVFGFTEWVFLL